MAIFLYINAQEIYIECASIQPFFNFTRYVWNYTTQISWTCLIRIYHYNTFTRGRFSDFVLKPCLAIYRVIQKDGLNWTVNGTSTHTRQLIVVFQVLCSLYGLTCMGYAQNSLEFFSRSPLIHAKNLVLHSSHFVLNWRCCTAVR